jgi:hypothetical protein
MSKAGWAVLALVLAGFAPATLGQATQSISGTVTDQSGGGVPKATVTVTQAETGSVHAAATSDQGAYTVLALAVGTYHIEVKATGFETLVHSDVTLQVGDQAVIDLVMKVGSVTQTVEVSSAAPTIDTTNAVIGGVVASQQVQNLPLNGRGFQDLTVLQPGVTLATTGQRSLSVGFGQKVSISGMRDSSSDYRLDGQDIDNAYNDLGSPTGEAAGIDAVQEYQVVTNPYSAEYGRTGAGLVEIVTKSGTNAFHGDVYDYLRNSAVDARNYFDPRTGPPPFRRNQFGGVLGGPIKKNKTFFFVNYEGLRQVLGSTTLLTVPDANAHNGIIINSSGTPVTVGVNPKVAPYLNLFPLPTECPCTAGTGRYPYVASGPTHENYALFRVDHQLTSSVELWGRYSFDSGQLEVPKDFTFTTADATATKYAAIGTTWTISPTMVNTAAMYYNRSLSGLSDIPTATMTSADIALFQLTPFRDPYGPSYMFFQASPATSIGGDGTRSDVWYNSLEWRDDLTINKGRHTLRIGFDAEHRQLNVFTSIYGGGDFAFTSIQNFLEDVPSTYSGLLSSTSPQYTDTQWIVGTYFQDDFRVNSKFTVNLGLRYEPETVPYFQNEKVAHIPDFMGINVPVSSLAVGNPFYLNPSHKNLAPRIGLAWSPFKNTVIRAGYGIFYDQLLSYDWITASDQDAPIFLRGGISASALPPGTTIDFPNAWTTQQSLLGGALFTNGLQFNPKQPTIQEYTLNIERQMGPNRVLTVSYVGTQGRHLLRNNDWNVMRIPTLGPNGPEVTGSVPESEASSLYWGPNAPIRNPAFDWMKVLTTDADSFYNGFTASFQQKYSNGLSYQASYTLGKSIDDASAILGAVDYSNTAIGPYRDAFLPGSDARGLSNFDVRNSLVMNVVYSLPWGRPGQSGFQSKLVNVLAAGWNVSGLGKIQSGSPFNPSGSLASAQRDKPSGWPTLDISGDPLPPNLVGASSPQAVHPQDPQNYYNVDAYTLPPPGTLGDLGRDQITGPGLVDFDFSLEKEGQIAPIGNEGLRLQFRFDVFNAFNRPNFAEPVSTLYSQAGPCNPTTALPSANCIDGTSFPRNANAGTITSTVTTSRQLQLAVKLIF